jgi:hypothetical protein
MGIFFFLMVCLLSACAVDYSRDDADELLKKKHIKAEYLSEEIFDKDTVWTYRDKKTDIEFQVMESWWESQFDGIDWDTSKLITNYGFLLSKKYMNEYERDITGELESVDDLKLPYLNKLILTYNFSNKSELKSKVDEVNDLYEFLFDRNKNCELEVVFKLDRKGFYFDYDEHLLDGTKEVKYENVESEYLISSIVQNDKEALGEFSIEDVHLEIENSSYRLYILKDGEYIPTDYISYNDFLYNSILRDLLEHEGVKVTSADDGFYAKTKSGEKKLYTGDISFGQVEEDFGIVLVQQNEIMKD